MIGPLADAAHEQLGTWAFDGQTGRSTQTPLPCPAKLLGNDRVNIRAGADVQPRPLADGFAAAIDAAQASDVVLCFVGEESILSGEAHSRADIRLPGRKRSSFMSSAKLANRSCW